MVDLTVTSAGMRFLGIDQSRSPDRCVAGVQVDVIGLIDPRATLAAARDCIAERAVQDAKWGESNHPDVPAGVKLPCAFFGIPSADAARLFCETAFRAGTGSNAHILLEEVSEAIEAAHDPVHLRAELVQVAAVAMKWIEQIDRRQGFGGADGKVPAVAELAGEGNAHG
jgi:hypothetical protein